MNILYPKTKNKKATHTISNGLGGKYEAIFTGLKTDMYGNNIMYMQFIIKYPTESFDGELVWCKESETEEIKI